MNLSDYYIKPVQKHLGLTPDGIAGIRTWMAIAKALGVVAGTEWSTVRASSFADPEDVRVWKKWRDIYIAQGMSVKEAEQKALAKGDNGVGKWMHRTAQTDYPMAALPRGVWEEAGKKGGDKMEVCYKDKIVRGILGDTLPRVPKHGVGIDLNPAYAEEFGLVPPFLVDDVKWRWIS